MKPVLKWIGRGVLAYMLLILLYVGWLFAATNLKFVSDIEKRLFKPVVGFVFTNDGDTVGLDFVINGESVPPDPRVSFRENVSLREIDTFVFALDGFKTARDVEMIRYVGLDPYDVVIMKSGEMSIQEVVKVKLRLHPMPIYVSRRSYAFADLQHLIATYRIECIPTILYDLALSVFDNEYKKSCELST
ncbi:MAG: hypothetical protein AAGF36_16915 [Pseudomonadota bacterium]